MFFFFSSLWLLLLFIIRFLSDCQILHIKLIHLSVDIAIQKPSYTSAFQRSMLCAVIVDSQLILINKANIIADSKRKRKLLRRQNCLFLFPYSGTKGISGITIIEWSIVAVVHHFACQSVINVYGWQSSIFILPCMAFIQYSIPIVFEMNGFLYWILDIRIWHTQPTTNNQQSTTIVHRIKSDANGKIALQSQ